VRRARKQTPRDLAVRFEGVPGEFLQIDWGEVRDMAATSPELAGQTRYFFAARLKYSRFMYVSFHSDMREETLLRCLIAAFQAIGGVPWVVVTDNMKTAVLGRNEQFEPVWNPAYQKLAAEFKFHPEACAPASGNQKGTVENLVLCRHLTPCRASVRVKNRCLRATEGASEPCESSVSSSITSTTFLLNS